MSKLARLIKRAAVGLPDEANQTTAPVQPVQPAVRPPRPQIRSARGRSFTPAGPARPKPAHLGKSFAQQLKSPAVWGEAAGQTLGAVIPDSVGRTLGTVDTGLDRLETGVIGATRGGEAADRWASNREANRSRDPLYNLKRSLPLMAAGSGASAARTVAGGGPSAAGQLASGAVRKARDVANRSVRSAFPGAIQPSGGMSRHGLAGNPYVPRNPAPEPIPWASRPNPDVRARLTRFAKGRKRPAKPMPSPAELRRRGAEAERRFPSDEELRARGVPKEPNRSAWSSEVERLTSALKKQPTGSSSVPTPRRGGARWRREVRVGNQPYSRMEAPGVHTPEIRMGKERFNPSDPLIQKRMKRDPVFRQDVEDRLAFHIRPEAAHPTGGTAREAAGLQRGTTAKLRQHLASEELVDLPGAYASPATITPGQFGALGAVGMAGRAVGRRYLDGVRSTLSGNPGRMLDSIPQYAARASRTTPTLLRGDLGKVGLGDEAWPLVRRHEADEIGSMFRPLLRSGTREQMVRQAGGYGDKSVRQIRKVREGRPIASHMDPRVVIEEAGHANFLSPEATQGLRQGRVTTGEAGVYSDAATELAGQPVHPSQLWRPPGRSREQLSRKIQSRWNERFPDGRAAPRRAGDVAVAPFRVAGRAVALPARFAGQVARTPTGIGVGAGTAGMGGYRLYRERQRDKKLAKGRRVAEVIRRVQARKQRSMVQPQVATSGM
jgi:hypothetical protein